MLWLLAAHLLTACVAPTLVRRLGARAFYLLAAVPAAAVVWAAFVPAGLSESYPWVGQLGLSLTLRVNSLSWLMVVLVGGVGALVLTYCASYFRDDEPGLGKFAAVFIAFAGAMLGLVISDDLILLYIFWELTTVFSFLLIAHYQERRTSRRAASQALIVTTLGGLAMLVGFIMLAQQADSYLLSEVVTNLPHNGYTTAALVLVLVGALSKSAIVPFSFWLPAAMAAPTPVSAYLHAAAMVKAGVYLIAQFAPFANADPVWQTTVLVAGAVTMLMAGWTALRQTDLKLLLAYGTVSQLGLLTVVLGVGAPAMMLAGTAMLLAHALCKAALFLVVGIVDRRAGTRDLTVLSGLGRKAPVLFVAAALAGASMAGFPPLLGFVAKESVFGAFLDAGSPVNLLTVLVLGLGSVLTVAYTLRFLWGAFASKPSVPTTSAQRPRWPFLAPPVVLAVTGLAAGFGAPFVDRLINTGQPEHLALWHGFTPALLISAVVLLLGGLLFGYRDLLGPVLRRLQIPHDGSWFYANGMHQLSRLAVETTGATQRGSLPSYLGIILVVMVVFPGGALLATLPWGDYGLRLWTNPAQVVVAALIATAAVLAVRAQRRLTALVLVGVTGYGTAVLFVLHGAPDLGLTQFLVETVTIILFVLVLRRLPSHFSTRPMRATRWWRLTIGAAVGTLAAGLAYLATASRQARPISDAFPGPVESFGGGYNIVNVILVDMRAWDTMGEISVLVVAATGVASLIFLGPRVGPLRRTRLPLTPQQSPVWLAAAARLGPGQRSIIMEVIVRLLFHTIILYSLYLLFAGHNSPGGGFAGGLVAGLALAVRYMAGGRHELNEAAPVGAGPLLGVGLFLAVGSGITSLLFGGAVLESAIIDLTLPVIGEIHVVTSLIFDIGVYLIVAGLMLDILRSLGGEVDRQAALETRTDEQDSTGVSS